MDTAPLPKVYTPEEVRTIFNISAPTFRDWVQSGIFQKITIPGKRRVFITSQSVEKLISGR
ncbi:helix-turn-helix domain-containing protein [Chryseosolibacter histidini]